MVGEQTKAIACTYLCALTSKHVKGRAFSYINRHAYMQRTQLCSKRGQKVVSEASCLKSVIFIVPDTIVVRKFTQTRFEHVLDTAVVRRGRNVFKTCPKISRDASCSQSNRLCNTSGSPGQSQVVIKETV